MKVLIISYAFPPENVIGALRVGKFAKYLHERKHEVRVIAAPPGSDKSLPLEFPAERIFYAKDRQTDTLFDPLVRLFRNGGGSSPPIAAVSGTSACASVTPKRRTLGDRARRHYYALLRIPDARCGWRSDAVSVGRRILATWRPDMIFASAPPVTGLFVASTLSREFGIPWTAEFRDLWSDNQYYAFPGWRRALDRIMEKRLLRTPDLIVTVTEPWAKLLGRKSRKPVAVALNGFAEEDVICAARPQTTEPGMLSIVYTGSIYRGVRDPSVLFEAISKLSSTDRASIIVNFYGPAEDQIDELAKRCSVSDRVKTHGAVPYKRSLQIQRDADILLLLLANDPADAGSIPAKFFEYIAAGRPILFMGWDSGVTAQMIRARRAGLASNDSNAIAAQLSAWIGLRRNGPLSGPDPSAKNGLSRTEQFHILEGHLAAFLSRHATGCIGQ